MTTVPCLHGPAPSHPGLAAGEPARLVADDSGHPRPHPFRVAQLPGVQADTQQRGRDGILGVFIVTQLRVSQGEEPQPQALHQLRESLPVAVPRPGRKRVFIGMGIHLMNITPYNRERLARRELPEGVVSPGIHSETKGVEFGEDARLPPEFRRSTLETRTGC